MSEIAEFYKKAEQMVLNRYCSEKDGLGRSQVWKVKEIMNDRKSGRDSTIMHEFLNEMEFIVNKLESSKPPQKKPVIHLSSPIEFPVVENALPHGMNDNLEWN